jgi:glyceraldehyde 3-phosphate dehydrogenase
MTTVHAYIPLPVARRDAASSFRRGRAAAANLVPATTGAALATTRALPEHAGRFDGIAIRAPVAVGSIADITLVTSRSTTVDEVNRILTEEAGTERYAGVLGVSREPLVSSDVIGDPRASIIDLELTKVVDGDLVKIMSWYDNEWGYANQMLREAVSVSLPLAHQPTPADVITRASLARRRDVLRLERASEDSVPRIAAGS